MAGILFFNTQASAQFVNGGIVTVAADTIPCRIAQSASEQGMKRQPGAYYHDYVVLVFANDSLRISYPGIIRAFFLHKQIGQQPQTSWYFSDSIDTDYDMLIKGSTIHRAVFLRQLVKGGRYQLWYFEQSDPGARNDRYFILEETATGKRNYFHSTSQLRRLLGKWPGYKRNSKRYRHWFKGKQYMVIDYNDSVRKENRLPAP